MPRLEFCCRNMVTVWLEPCGSGTWKGAENWGFRYYLGDFCHNLDKK